MCVVAVVDLFQVFVPFRSLVVAFFSGERLRSRSRSRRNRMRGERERKDQSGHNSKDLLCFAGQEKEKREEGREEGGRRIEQVVQSSFRSSRRATSAACVAPQRRSSGEIWVCGGHPPMPEPSSDPPNP